MSCSIPPQLSPSYLVLQHDQTNSIDLNPHPRFKSAPKGCVLIHLSVTFLLKTEPPEAVYNLQGCKMFKDVYSITIFIICKYFCYPIIQYNAPHFG